MESTFEFTGMDRTRPTLGLKGLEKRLRFPAALATVAKVVRCCKQDGKHFGLCLNILLDSSLLLFSQTFV